MSRVTSGDNKITQGYSNNHKAVDIGYSSKEENNKVLAHSSGKVVWMQTGQKNNPGSTGNASYGNAVKIQHPNGYYTLYAHLKEVYVVKGQQVSQGQIIGIIGNTGNSYGRHLHWEVRNKLDNRIDPTPYLNADLPGMSETILYQAYDNKKNQWLPKVKVGSNDYAGNKGNPISAFRCEEFEYQVHDMVKKEWLPWVKGTADYAGNLPNNIDGIRIKGAEYRVGLVKGGWLSSVKKADNTTNGYAGIYGKVIDRIQIIRKLG